MALSTRVYQYKPCAHKERKRYIVVVECVDGCHGVVLHSMKACAEFKAEHFPRLLPL